MSLFADLLSNVFDYRYRFGLARQDDRPVQDLTAALVGATGEVTGQAVARQIIDRYAEWSDDEKRAFFAQLAQDKEIDVEATTDAKEK